MNFILGFLAVVLLSQNLSANPMALNVFKGSFSADKTKGSTQCRYLDDLNVDIIDGTLTVLGHWQNAGATYLSEEKDRLEFAALNQGQINLGPYLKGYYGPSKNTVESKLSGRTITKKWHLTLPMVFWNPTSSDSISLTLTKDRGLILKRKLDIDTPGIEDEKFQCFLKRNN